MVGASVNPAALYQGDSGSPWLISISAMSEPFRTHMPVPSVRLLVRFVDERCEFEAVEQRHELGGVAVKMRMVPVVVIVDDEGVRRDFGADAEALMALRQHRAL